MEFQNAPDDDVGQSLRRRSNAESYPAENVSCEFEKLQSPHRPRFFKSFTLGFSLVWVIYIGILLLRPSILPKNLMVMAPLQASIRHNLRNGEQVLLARYPDLPGIQAHSDNARTGISVKNGPSDLIDDSIVSDFAVEKKIGNGLTDSQDISVEPYLSSQETTEPAVRAEESREDGGPGSEIIDEAEQGQKSDEPRGDAEEHVEGGDNRGKQAVEGKKEEQHQVRVEKAGEENKEGEQQEHKEVEQTEKEIVNPPSSEDLASARTTEEPKKRQFKRWRTAAELPECTWLKDPNRRTFDRDNSSSLSLLYESSISTIEEAFSATDHSYIMVYGAAIGIYRHDGTIPWDLDLDILVLSEPDKTERELATELEQGINDWMYGEMQGKKCRTLTSQGNSYRTKTKTVVYWYDPYYGEEQEEKDLIEKDIPFLRLHLNDPADPEDGLHFGNQVDMFMDPGWSRKLSPTLEGDAALCRCYFNGIAVRCAENTLESLYETYTTSVTTPKVNMDVVDRKTLKVRRGVPQWYENYLGDPESKLCDDGASDGETWLRRRRGEIPLTGLSAVHIGSTEGLEGLEVPEEEEKAVDEKSTVSEEAGEVKGDEEASDSVEQSEVETRAESEKAIAPAIVQESHHQETSTQDGEVLPVVEDVKSVV